MRSHSRVAKRLSAIALPRHSPAEPVDATILVSRQVRIMESREDLAETLER